MIEVKGKYNTAKVFTDNLDQTAAGQIRELCNQEFVKDSKIRIMPDTHAGAGSTIGTTMTIKDKVVPNMVGVDIGCGMLVHRLKDKSVDFEKLDKIIRRSVPSGFNIRKVPHEYNKYLNLRDLKCSEKVDLKRASLSIGTLGGGNHFIEMNKNEAGNIYLVIHSGSRHLGKQIADIYQARAIKERKSSVGYRKDEFNRALAYVEGQAFDDYIHDMNIAQKFADYNRKAMAQVIIDKMGFTVIDHFTSIHNYIDLEQMILRKGAVSAKKDEVIIIPINMRDGSIIATGKGRVDWNLSAPHGAGRLMSRTEAKRVLSLKDFQKSMKGIFTTSVSTRTLDEAPSAYKPIAEIIANIKDAVDINKIIRPIYNYKA